MKLGSRDGEPSFIHWMGLFLAGMIASVGTLWAFQRGGRDFDVFYHAWRLVLDGRGLEVYSNSPDRFLYAPGFAWLFSPLALLPRNISLALWCLAKAACLGWIVRAFSLSSRNGVAAMGLGAWGVILLARPILIDFQYGQVNLFILFACAWALMTHFKKGDPSWVDGLSWAFLGIAAIAKIFPLPVLLVPWLLSRGANRKRLLLERSFSLFAILIVLLTPAISLGLSGAWDLLLQWRGALVAKGFPLESHNQSFAAFLHHYLTDQATPVLSQGGRGISFGYPILDAAGSKLLSMLWMVLSGAAILVWLFRASHRAPLPWSAVLIAMLILPSHLVWKPYFVMGLPLAVLALQRFKEVRGWLIFLFIAVNLTGFDFVGGYWGARFEAASTFLWAHLVLIWLVARQERAVTSSS